MQRKPYTRYSREFKLEAVRQAALGEKPRPADRFAGFLRITAWSKLDQSLRHHAQVLAR